MNELITWDDDFTDPWVESPCVILQHGNLRNGALWRGWVPYLARQFRVLRPDLPGHGRNGNFAADHFATIDDLAERTRELLAERGIERVHYVGEGLGGALGVSFAVAHPDCVASLTALSLPLRMHERAKSHAVGFASWEEAVRTLGTRKWWLTAQQASAGLVGDPLIDEYIADEVGRTTPEAAVHNSRRVATWNVGDLLPRVDCPVLFVRSERSGSIDDMANDGIASLPPNGREYIVPGVSTPLFTYAYPDRIAPVVATFISAHS